MVRVTLYDLSADPGEENDLAGKYPKKVKQLEALVSEARIPMRPQREPEHPKGRRFN